MKPPNPPKVSDLIPLEDVCRLLPTRTHRSTVFRWAQKGRHGIRLRVVTVGCTKCTTEAWLMDFFASIEAASQNARRGQAKGPARPAAPSPQAVRTRETLKRHGLLP